MSHLTHIKTRFQNLVYLEKALNRLNMNYQPSVMMAANGSEIHLRIPQKNGYNIEFAWNGEEYEIMVDMSFWEQSYPLESFLDKLAQHYAGEVILGESQKMGFQPVNYQKNQDGSKTLILERWNSERM